METSDNLLPTPSVKGNHNRKGASKRSGDGLATALQSTSSPEASPASLFLQPDEGAVQKMIATSGRRCFASYASFIPGGSSVKTLAASLLGMEVWYSSKCMLTWKAKVTTSRRLLFQLVPSTRRTAETGSGLLPTATATTYGSNQSQSDGAAVRPSLNSLVKMLPTPRRADGDKGVRSPEGHAKERQRRGNGEDLPTAIAMLPTPTTRDYKDTGNLDNVPDKALLGRRLGKSHGLKLQPAFVEWMMGYPERWTELPDSKLLEMRSFRRSQRKS